MKESAGVLEHLLGVCNGQRIVDVDRGDGCVSGSVADVDCRIRWEAVEAF